MKISPEGCEENVNNVSRILVKGKVLSIGLWKYESHLVIPSTDPDPGYTYLHITVGSNTSLSQEISKCIHPSIDFRPIKVFGANEKWAGW